MVVFTWGCCTLEGNFYLLLSLLGPVSTVSAIFTPSECSLDTILSKQIDLYYFVWLFKIMYLSYPLTLDVIENEKRFFPPKACQSVGLHSSPWVMWREKKNPVVLLTGARELEIFYYHFRPTILIYKYSYFISHFILKSSLSYLQ